MIFKPTGIIISPCCPDAVINLVSQMLIGLPEIFGASLISFFFQLISLSNEFSNVGSNVWQTVSLNPYLSNQSMFVKDIKKYRLPQKPHFIWIVS